MKAPALLHGIGRSKYCGMPSILFDPIDYVWIKFEFAGAVLALCILIFIFGKFYFSAETLGAFKICQRLLNFAPLTLI